MKAIIRTLLFLIVLLYGTGLMGAPQLSDREAASLIDATWYSAPDRLPLGAYAVVGGLNPGAKTDLKRHEIEGNYYKYLLAWEKQGVLKIDKKKQLGPETKDKDFWKDFGETIDRGTQMKIFISATQKGLELEKTSGFPRQEEVLTLRMATYKTTKVLRNEERKKGKDDYRIVMLTYSARWMPEKKAVNLEVWGTSLSEERKATVLLKHDVFENKWKVVAFDEANAGEEFKTAYVDRTLGN